jgi:hypothetical protein
VLFHSTTRVRGFGSSTLLAPRGNLLGNHSLAAGLRGKLYNAVAEIADMKRMARIADWRTSECDEEDNRAEENYTEEEKMSPDARV